MGGGGGGGGLKETKISYLDNPDIGIFVLCVKDICLQWGPTRLSPTPPVDCVFALPVLLVSIPIIY